MLQEHQRVGVAGVGELHARLGGIRSDEHLVLRHLPEADHRGRLDVERAQLALALDRDRAVGAIVTDDGGPAGQDGELLGREPVRLVDDPALLVTLGAHLLDRVHRLGRHEPVLVEVGVDVQLPVEDAHQVVEVVPPLLRHVLEEKLLGRVSLPDQRLEHREDVGGALRLVGEQRARCVQDPRWYVPAGAGAQPVSPRQIQDAVVALVPGREAAPDVLLRRLRVEAEEGVGKPAAVVVELLREVVGLGLALAAHVGGPLVGLVHVERQRLLVVEELAVHHPAAELLHDLGPEQLVAGELDGVLEQHLRRRAVPGLDVAEPLVGERLRSVVRLGGGSEPALVDAAAMSTERIVVVRVQLEPLPRYAERAGHPARHEPQDAVALVQSGLDLLPVSSHFLDLATCGVRPQPAALREGYQTGRGPPTRPPASSVTRRRPPAAARRASPPPAPPSRSTTRTRWRPDRPASRGHPPRAHRDAAPPPGRACWGRG